MNKLTKVQEEYFKDSKVRDDKGDLIVAYHGTDTTFNNFTNVRTEPGYWFTEDREYAEQHGDVIVEVYLDIKNPIDLEITEEDNLFWSLCRDCFKVEDVNEDMALSNTFKNYLEEIGYDGLMWRHDDDYTVIAFKPEQIKSIDNLYPTNSHIFTDNKEEYIQQINEKNDIKKAINFVSDDGLNLKDLSPVLKNNEEIVKAAITNNSKSIKYASDRIKDNLKLLNKKEIEKAKEINNKVQTKKRKVKLNQGFSL